MSNTNMTELLRFLDATQRFYEEQALSPPGANDRWLDAVEKFSVAATEVDFVGALTEGPRLPLSFQHIGALTSVSMDEAINMLRARWGNVTCDTSTVMSRLVGYPLTIVSSRMPERTLELFTINHEARVNMGPKRARRLVGNWGRLGIGMHLGYKITQPDYVDPKHPLELLFTTLSALSDNFVSYDFSYSPGQKVWYLDGWIGATALRIEVSL